MDIFVFFVFRGGKRKLEKGGWVFWVIEYREGRFGVWDILVGEITIMGIDLKFKRWW